MPTVPRRFRRRLLLVMLAAGLLPLLGLGALGGVALARALPRAAAEAGRLRGAGRLARSGAAARARTEEPAHRHAHGAGAAVARSRAGAASRGRRAPRRRGRGAAAPDEQLRDFRKIARA